MLQQTGVKTVGPYFEKFLARWPDVDGAGPRLAGRRAADVGRARLLFARAQPARLRGRGAARAWRRFPGHEQGLRALPGIGPYTAAAIAAIAFDVRTMPVDGNIERVVSRLFAVEQPLPQAKPLIRRIGGDACSA